MYTITMERQQKINYMSIMMRQDMIDGMILIYNTLSTQ